MKKIVFIILFLSSGLNAFSSISVKVDIALFRYNDTLNILEIYYAFPDNAVQLLNDGDIKRGQIGFAIGIISGGDIIDSVQWVQEINIPKKNKDYVSDLVGLKTILVPHGKYNLKFIALDMFDKNSKDIREISFNSPEYPDDELLISNIQIAAAVEPESAPTQSWNKSFLKNSLYVIPNPGRDIIGSSPKINSYFEIYNARKLLPKGLRITYTIYNAGEKEVFSIHRNKSSFADAMVEYVSIPVDALPTGVYYYEVRIAPDEDGAVPIITRKKKIYVSNYEIPPQAMTEFYENLPFEQSEFATMTEEQIITSFEQIEFIASDYELDVWDKCQTLGAKQRYMFTFWTSRNTDTTKPYNEALEEFRQRINYTNKYFKHGLLKEGWRSDRGRMYIKYGPPTEVERHVQAGDKLAYEKWFYHEMQGGIEFVFVDFNKNGNYRIVHSTAVGEARNDNWYEQYIEKQDPGPNFEYQKSNY